MDSKNIIDAISELYLWLDEQACDSQLNSCNACGNCCDFDAYGHRLYITTLELMYLADKLGKANIKPMTGGRCPYQMDNKCGIHQHRFASCRIFFCRSDSGRQGDISEATLAKLKAISAAFDIPYRYMDLKTALGGGMPLR